MMKYACTFALIIVSACTQPTVLRRPAPAPLPPTDPSTYVLKLGLISDSQLQTLKTPGQIALFRRNLHDRLYGFALRPPAVDKAAPFMMTAQLEQLAGADIIIYLGDAANNGCEDEIAHAFELLSAFRTRTRIPLFFVIGNHDYLGAGNTSVRQHREALCGAENRALTKLDVIRRAHEFNEMNIPLLTARGGAFVDNFSPGTVEACQKTDTSGGEDQHMNLGCFLSGFVTLADSSQILLLDTSDYADIRYGPAQFRWLTNVEFSGLRGSVSFDSVGSQGVWLREQIHKHPEATKIRIVASHYNLEGMRWNLFLFQPGRVVGIPSQYLSPIPEMGNHWFYGHTHAQRPTVIKSLCYGYGASDICDADLDVEVNVGSTTDWWPHVAMAYVGRQTIVIPLYLGGKCPTYMDLIWNEARNENALYRTVNGRSHGIILFGLDRSYQDYRDGASDRSAAYANAERLATRAVEAGYAETTDEAWVCLGFIGAWYEKVGGTPQP